VSGGPLLSIVIPTFNNGWILHRTIDRLRAQDAPLDRFEIVVVDDGSGDGSTDGLETAGPPAVRVVRQRNQGRSVARNRGAAEARGRVLLFLDADVWASPGLVAAHLRHHAGRGHLGVQGPSPPAPESLTTLFMRACHVWPDWTRRRLEDLSPFHVITRNFSVDREAFVRAGGFDEGFTGYGWEDMELAIRLTRHGVLLRYEPAALAHHYHIQTLEEAREKLRQAGEGAVYWWEKQNREFRLGLFLEILPFMLPVKWFVYRSGIITAAIWPLKFVAERLGLTVICGEMYSHLLWRSFYQGVFAARRRARSAAAPAEAGRAAADAKP
jgi:glycosyltransferase involved in cell wall biosynthesis